MAGDTKKISFGFSKVNKKPTILPQKNEVKAKEIQFIDCLEEKSIKLINGDEKKNELPVIPLINGNILRDNMIAVLKAKKAEEKQSNSSRNLSEKDENNKEEGPELTLDELAAKEILEDLNKVEENEDTKEILTIPQPEVVKVSEKESTLEDYEDMPVNQFGLAVLRGMGWEPEKGIGKNAQIVVPINPTVRPKGMGLGADKVISIPKTDQKDGLVMKKGASVKIISGPNKDLYGQIEGFDELPGRIMVRLSLKNVVVSMNENLVHLVTLKEYNQNSKVLNLKEFNEFSNKTKDFSENKIKDNKKSGSNSDSSYVQNADNKKQPSNNYKNLKSDENINLKRSTYNSEDKYGRTLKYSGDKRYSTQTNKHSKHYESSSKNKNKYTRDKSISSDSEEDSKYGKIKKTKSRHRDISNSDSEKEIKYDKLKKKKRHHRDNSSSSNSDSEKINKYENSKVKSKSSSLDSPSQHKKYRSKKHHKHDSRTRSRSRSRSSIKKRRHRHRSSS